MRHKVFLPIIPILLFTCFGCGQTTTQELIQDGTEAATVAAVLVLNTTLPAVAPKVVAGLNGVAGTALKMLSFPGNTLTVEQLINLDIASGDPYLAHYQAIINFALPILNQIPGISGALNTPIDYISPNIRADLQAFFTGIQLGLGQPSGTTIEDLIAQNPRVKKAVQRANLRDFDPNALANALRAADGAASGKAEVIPEPKWSCANGHCPLRSGMLHSNYQSVPSWSETREWDSDGDGHGQGCYH